MLKWLCLAVCCSGVVDAFGFGPMSTNGFQFSLPGFSSWPSDSTIVGNVRERFNKMLNNFGKEKSGVKTKVRNDNEGDRSVTTVTQDGNGYHSITRFSERGDGQEGQHHRRRHHRGRNRNLKETQCSGSDPCGEMHFCNPLTNICQKVQPEGSTCQFKNQCGPPELGIRCIWGRCAQAAQGSLGSLCIRDLDCLPNAYCTLHQSISPFYPMCTPKLDEGATCGVPRSDLNPLAFVGSLFGSKCAVEKPQHDYCKEGLKCAPVGWFGSYVCVPISLKVTPYACAENDQENTIGEGTYPEEPVTEEILEQEIEEQADREGNAGPDNKGNKEETETAPNGQNGPAAQGSVSISLGDDSKEGKESQTQEQETTSPGEGGVQQALQAIAEKIKQAGQAPQKEEEEERNQENEQEKEESSDGTGNMSEETKTKLKDEAQKSENEKQTPAGQNESDATESTGEDEPASPQDTGTGEDEGGVKGTAKPTEALPTGAGKQGPDDDDEEEESKSGSGEEDKQESGPKYGAKNEEKSKGENQPANGGTIAGEDENSGPDSTDQSMKPKGRKDAPGPSGMPAEGTLTPGETKDEKEKAKKVKDSEEDGSTEQVPSSGQEDGESGRRPSNAGPQRARRPVQQTYGINPLYVPPAGTGPRPPPQQPPPKRRRRKGKLNANQYQGGLYQAAQARPWYPAMQQPQQQPAGAAQYPWAQQGPYQGRRRKGRPNSKGKQA